VSIEVSPSAIDNAAYLVHRQWMSRALALAQAALLVKFSRTVIVDADGNLIAEAENRRERDKDHSTCRNSGSTVNWSRSCKTGTSINAPFMLL